jgi:hypothetical protein
MTTVNMEGYWAFHVSKGPCFTGFAKEIYEDTWKKTILHELWGPDLKCCHRKTGSVVERESRGPPIGRQLASYATARMQGQSFHEVIKHDNACPFPIQFR